MKPYLNNAEKQNFILGSGSATAIGTLIDRVQGHLPTGIVANLKRARTYMDKALTAWMEPVEEKSKQMVMRQARGVTIGVISDVTKKAEQAAYVKYVRDVRMEAYQDGGRDHVLDLCEATMQLVCQKCDGKCREKCQLYEAYRKFEIEFWNADHPRCEYAGTGEVEA